MLVEGKRIWSENIVLYPALSVSLDCWPSLITQAFLSPDKSLSKPSDASRQSNWPLEEWIVVKIHSPQGQGCLLITLDHRRYVSFTPRGIKIFICHRAIPFPSMHFFAIKAIRCHRRISLQFRRFTPIDASFLCHRGSSRPVRCDSPLTSEGFVIAARGRLRQVLEKLHADTLQT